MRKFVTIILAGAALSAAAAPAFAQDARWSDAEYLRASRCLGLAEAKGLGAIDAGGLESRIDAQGRGRERFVVGRGASMREQARLDGKTKNEVMKAKLLAERDGVCKVYTVAAAS